MARDRRNAESWNHATSFQDVAGIVASERCVEVLWAVLRHPRSVTALADDLELAVSSVSHCLGVLTQAGLVTFDGHDRRRDYRTTDHVALRVRDGKAELVLRTSEGSDLVVVLSAELIARLGKHDRRASATDQPAGKHGAAPTVEVRPVAVPGPPGGAPTGPRPTSAPG